MDHGRPEPEHGRRNEDAYTRVCGDCTEQREDTTAAQAGQTQGGRQEAAAARAGCARKACCSVWEITQTTLQRPGGTTYTLHRGALLHLLS